MVEFWNNRYEGEEAVYGKGPNAYFADSLLKLAPGRILLPCDGEGRNAVFAAKNGWEVHSFDFSNSGVHKAKKWAAESGVVIDAQVADAFEYEASIEFDVVALIYAHMPADLRNAFHHRAVSWLRTGGTLILEGFNPSQHAFSSGGPKDATMLFDAATIAKDFDALQTLHLEEITTELHEGPYHQGQAALLRYKGLKATE